MTQAQTGATFRKGRLLRSAAVSALSLSALAGGVVLSGGEAQAALTHTYFDSTLNQTFTDTLTVIQEIPGSGPSGLIPLSNNWPNYNVTIDWDGNGPKTGVNLYRLDKTSPDGPAWYDKVQLRYEQPAQGAFAGSKTICSAAFLDGVCSPTNGGTILASLTSPDGTPVSANLPGQYSTIYVKDSITNLPHLNNDFRNVPGPLPILGAGAAFGFSRKLRGRIKAASNA